MSLHKRLFVLLSLLVTNLVFDWPMSPRFSYSSLNYITGTVVAIAFLISYIFLARSISGVLLRVVAAIAGTAITLCVGIIVLLSFVTGAYFRATSPPGITLESSTHIGSTNYVLYLDGADNPPISYVRKEYEALPGLKFVHTVWRGNCEFIGKLQVTEGSSIAIIQPDGSACARIPM